MEEKCIRGWTVKCLVNIRKCLLCNRFFVGLRDRLFFSKFFTCCMASLVLFFASRVGHYPPRVCLHNEICCYLNIFCSVVFVFQCLSHEECDGLIPGSVPVGEEVTEHMLFSESIFGMPLVRLFFRLAYSFYFEFDLRLLSLVSDIRSAILNFFGR